MYGLTTFLSVLWHTVTGWFGFGKRLPPAVTLFNGADEFQVRAVKGPIEPHGEDNLLHGGADLDIDVRATHPNGWGFDTHH